MAIATFSEGTGVTEAISKNTISDVLSLLPDNTAKEITPRDVRDAVLSTWENSVIRYTTDGSTDYIGIDRQGIKDVKLFLGKKQMSGTNIMSSSLLGSDTDIFLYNTKSDSAVTQDFKLSVLAGTSSAIFTVAPYIKGTFVSGVEEYISLDIVNPATYGTINIESGLSASVTINDLIFPSQGYVNYVTTNPGVASASTNTDLFLAVSPGNNTVELKTYQSSGGVLGNISSPTNIYGSTVYVNGDPLTFTNTIPTGATVGGIQAGSTFNDVSIVDMLSQLLYPYLPPAAKISISGLSFNNTFERDHSSGYTVNYSYTLTKTTDDITSTSLLIVRQSTVIATIVGSVLSGTGLVTQTYTGTQFISGVTLLGGGTSIRNFYTFSCTPFDGTSYGTGSTIFEGVFPYFYGFSTTNTDNTSTINSTVLPALTKRVDAKIGLTLSLAGTGYLYFCYPAIYGTLSNIKDGNDYVEYTHGSSGAWTYSNPNLNSPSGKWSSIPYYVYRKYLASTIPPSQNYKFNF